MNELVEPVERQHVLPDPCPRTRPGDCAVPGRRLEPGERCDDHQGHAIGQRVLVDLVLEGAEHEQPEDRGEQLGGQQRDGQRDDPPQGEQEACNNTASEQNLRPDNITTGESAALIRPQS